MLRNSSTWTCIGIGCELGQSLVQILLDEGAGGGGNLLGHFYLITPGHPGLDSAL